MTDETLKQAKSKTKLGKSIRETRLTSLAAGDYAYRFTYEDGTSDAVTTSGKLLKQKQLVKAKSHEVNEKARAFWDQVNQAHLSTQTFGEIGTESDGVTDVNPNEWESGYSSISRNYIAQVPDYYQYIYDSANVNFTGCTPTASANMVQYLGFGLSDIDKTMWSLRSYLHTTQGETGDGWTLWDDETPGLLAYAKSVRPSANPTVTLYGSYTYPERDAQYWELSSPIDQ